MSDNVLSQKEDDIRRALGQMQSKAVDFPVSIQYLFIDEHSVLPKDDNDLEEFIEVALHRISMIIEQVINAPLQVMFCKYQKKEV